MFLKIFRRLSAGLFLAHIFFFSVGAACAGEFVLAEDGVARAPVVVFEGAPPLTRRAADELAEYIEKISGVKPEVLEGRPEPLPESAVWVGRQPVLEELFPDLDLDFEHPEEILISTDGSHLVIAGRDRWDPDNLVVTGRHGRAVNGWQAEYGTVNAIYTFLRDQLEVRWLWPGETGLDIIPKERIAFEPFEYRHHPQIRLRSGIFYHSAPTDGRGVAQDWVRFQRVALDSSNQAYRLHQAVGGHAFGRWWERFHESNPDYFALQPDGTRSGFPSPGDAKICQSNPAVWEQWLDDVAEMVEENPLLDLFDGSFNDSWSSGHCICENCRAWDVPEAPRRRLMWQGLSQEYVALSDRDVRFANKLARGLRERFPGRDYRVRILGYGVTLPGPLENVPEDNVIVGHVSSFFAQPLDTPNHHYPDEKNAQMFADWGATGAKMWWRPNVTHHTGIHQLLPAAHFGLVIDNFRFLADHNCTGIYIDTINEAWPTMGPLYYLMAHLAWDPYADGRAILDDYYRRGFGPAHEQLRGYWTLMEEAGRLLVYERLPFPEAYGEEVFRRAGALLDEAEAILADGPEKYHARLAHVRVGFDFSRMVVENMVLMERYRESRGQDTEAADKVRANWEEIMEITPGNLFYMNMVRWLKQGRRGPQHPDHL